ncbi:MAG: MFS transporter [Bacillota bacterium]
MKDWRRNLYLTWGAQLLALLGFNFPISFLPYYVMELGVQDPRLVTAWSSALTAVPALLLAVFSPIWGSMSDRYGKKIMVSRAMLAGFITFFFMARVQSVEGLFMLRLLQGVFTGTIGACMAMVCSMVPPEHLGSSLGLMQTAVFSGTAFGPLIGGIAADTFGTRVSFQVACVLLLSGFTVVTWLVRETGSPGNNPQKAAGGSPFSGLSMLFTSRDLLKMSFILFVAQVSIKAMAPVMPLFVKELSSATGGLSTLSGLVISVTGLAAALSATYLGRLADSVGPRRVLAACAAITAVLFFLHTFARSIASLLVLRTMTGLVLGGVFPTANTIIGAAVREEERGKAYGVASSASYFGNFIGPLVAGIFASYLGIRSVFVLIAFLFGVSFITIRRIASPKTDSTFGCTEP